MSKINHLSKVNVLFCNILKCLQAKFKGYEVVNMLFEPDTTVNCLWTVARSAGLPPYFDGGQYVHILPRDQQKMFVNQMCECVCLQMCDSCVNLRKSCLEWRKGVLCFGICTNRICFNCCVNLSH